MPITDQRAVTFSNEAVRPMAAKLRALKINIDATIAMWFQGINALVPNDSGTLTDNRQDTEGASLLTGADINNVVAQLQTIQTQLNQPGVAGMIEKACVSRLPIQ